VKAGLRPLASIAAMPKRLRPILLALILAGASAGVLGCGGDDNPEPSIPATEAQTLLAKITEVQANVDVGSCLVAQDKADELVADIEQLPATVNEDVRRALDSGANQLRLLLADPSQCQGPTTTSEPTTTTEPTTTQEEQTTTERDRRETTTTPTQTEPDVTTTPTQTAPTPTSGGSGGIGPGGL
jgi:hypothetical protein